MDYNKRIEINLTESFSKYLEMPYKDPDTAVTPKFVNREFIYRGRVNNMDYYKRFTLYMDDLIKQCSSHNSDVVNYEISRALSLKRLVDYQFDIPEQDKFYRYKFNTVSNVCLTSCARFDTIPLMELLAFDNKSKEYQVVYDTTTKLAELLGVLSGGNVDDIKVGIQENLTQAVNENRIDKIYSNYSVYSEGILGSFIPSEIKDISPMIGICPELDQLFLSFRDKIEKESGIVVHGTMVLPLLNLDEIPYLLNIYIIIMLHELEVYILDNIINDVNYDKIQYNYMVDCNKASSNYAVGFGIISSRSKGILVVQNPVRKNDVINPEFNGLPEVEYANYRIKGTNGVSFSLDYGEFGRFKWADKFILSNYIPEDIKHCRKMIVREGV